MCQKGYARKYCNPNANDAAINATRHKDTNTINILLEVFMNYLDGSERICVTPCLQKEPQLVQRHVQFITFFPEDSVTDCSLPYTVPLQL